MKKILLIDFDSKIPNLALLKLSAFHKSRGDSVFLNNGCGNPDKVYVSCIYTQNGPQVRGLTTMYPNVEIGGSGISLTKALPESIEHTCPDYDLYNMDYSMGFTSRGCVRRCPFCIVWRKEKWNPNHAELNEFLRHDKLVLLDNNLTASPRFAEVVKDLTDRGIRTNFNQGMDIRLITEEKAGLLADVKARDFGFSERMLYFAWDSIDSEEDVKRGIDLLKNAGIRGSALTFYILVGFDSTLEIDKYRALKLHNWGVVPYAQIYNDGGMPGTRAANTRIPKAVRRFAREVNRKDIWYSKHPRPVQLPHLPKIE